MPSTSSIITLRAVQKYHEVVLFHERTTHPPRPYGFFLLNILYHEYEVSWQCMEVVWGLSRECQGGVWKVSGRCLEGVWKVSGMSQRCLVGFMRSHDRSGPNGIHDPQCFGPKFFYLYFWGPNFMLHFRFSVIFSISNISDLVVLLLFLSKFLLTLFFQLQIFCSSFDF